MALDLAAWQTQVLGLAFASVALMTVGLFQADRDRYLKATGGIVFALAAFVSTDLAFEGNFVLPLVALGVVALVLVVFGLAAKRRDALLAGAWAAFVTYALVGSRIAFDFSSWQPPLLVVAFASMGLLLLGFAWRDTRTHYVRAAGWVLFALYWPFQASEFFFPTHSSEPDPINGWFTLVGPLFLLWIANHELKSLAWKEDPPALRWFTGAVAVTALTYFVIAGIPGVATWLMHSTAEQSAWLYNALFFGGSDRAYVSFIAGESHICLPAGSGIPLHPNCPDAGYAVTVILACTAIQSIMIFVGAIACLKAANRRKWIGYALTVPTIFFLNLFRNAGIVYGTYDLEWGMFGMAPFEWMHAWVGKLGSLAAMVLIALGLFVTLPELHNNILDLFDLRKRNGPRFFSKPPPPPPTKVEPARRPGDA